MSIKERLNEDMKSAMRMASSDPEQRIRLSAIRLLNSEIKNTEILKKSELSDDEILSIIQRQIKQRQEAAELYRKGGRANLVEKEEKEAALLAEYLPEQLSDSDIRELVQEVIQETSATSIKDMGKVMSIIMPKVRGRADGKRVNELASEILRG